MMAARQQLRRLILPTHFHRAILPQARHLTTAQTNGHRFDQETDVLIVGSGAAGLTAALRAHSHGLSSLVIEKDAQIGGTSAYSGGGLWIPNNPLAVEAGITDTPEQAMTYLTSVIDADTPDDTDVRRASSPARKRAFLTHGPRMVSFLRDRGFAWRLSPGCPDYYPHAHGALPTGGRSIEPDVFDARRLELGEKWTEAIRQRPGRSLPLFTYEASSATRMGSSWRDVGAVLRVLLRSIYLSRVRGQIPVTMGKSLVAQLLWLHTQLGQGPVLTDTALRQLIATPEGAVLGARVATPDGERNIRARRGVLLCAGGFAHNQGLRERYGPPPANAEWTSAAPGDDGDGIVAGVRVGAATALMDEAWWGPTLRDPVRGMYYFALQERARPFGVIVDSSGKRFMNEAEPYTDAGHHQYARKAVPAWFVFDWNHRKRYAVGSLMPRQQPPAQALEAGYIHRAETIAELARQIGVDEDALQGTLARFNEMADCGVDSDFARGESAFDNYFGDTTVRPNPNLGAVRTPPFYAIPLVPGDLGTKGGLLTDEHARVIREDGTPVQGLYAAGNTTASVMGRTYPGAGATLGPAMTFAFIAMDHISSEHV
ncbi:3-ketosteroid 1-dehydrogenase helE [Aspergillus novofumigatus IBT 16806]|uniref:FAD binding domain protein n=1 Tax=Aspergillus novofumigatus (strain IBT 16806) TaxID=1392255 RepID=A0A2I1CJP3_ASPN1|nr:FAD binding domain protein [Aspergillus novofumigatus IBT 16806]PKX97848.1 FAD binding domain protein [Aspergillus novofumigatus IBT 16806]